jgi:hypothetical protein
VLEPEQGVVGAGHGQQDLIELALSRPLVARLGVLNDEDHGERERGHHSLEDGFPPRGKPAGQGPLAGSGELGCEFAERNLVSLGKGWEGVHDVGQGCQGDAGADRDAGL